MIKLRAPDGGASVGFDCVEYPVRDGQVDVPDEAEAPLRAHGYRRPAAEARQAVRPPADQKKR